MTIFGTCPNCEAIWSIEEIMWDTCASCGWPDTDDDDDEFTDWAYLTGEEHDEKE